MEEEVVNSQERIDNYILNSLCPNGELPVISDSELQNLQDISPLVSSCNLDDSSDEKHKKQMMDRNSDQRTTSISRNNRNVRNVSAAYPPANEVSREILDSVALEYPPSPLPATNNWPGDFNFHIYFHPQERKAKAVSWMYSSDRDKLYVAKNAPCPVSFKTNASMMPSDTKIRAMPVFTQPEFSSDIVRRCVNHTVVDANNGVTAPEHLIRCECLQARYETNETTGRQSVVVPYENPDSGNDTSTYIFKFACFGSCSGGLNRRPIMIIFTLERGNKVIGRRSLDVKICACPVRDCNNDDRHNFSKREGKQPMQVKRKEPDSSNLANVFNFVNEIHSITGKKSSSSSSDKDGCYTIKVRNLETYEFLINMKTLYEMFRTVLNSEHQRIVQKKLKIKKEKSTDESE